MKLLWRRIQNYFYFSFSIYFIRSKIDDNKQKFIVNIGVNITSLSFIVNIQY